MLAPLIFVLVVVLLPPDNSVFGCPAACTCEAGGKVYCESQGLTALPTGMPSNTKRLEMFDNNIKVIRNGAFMDAGIRGVTELYLDNNNIDVVEKYAFRGLTNLNKILIRYNNIKSVDPDQFKDSPNIKQVYLCGNDITVPADIPFLNAYTLEVLLLDSCAIHNVPRQMFYNTPNLKHLVIDNNGLETLDPAAFSKLKSLRYLSLAKNRLKGIPFSLIWKLKSLRQIQLTGNEWSCDCQLKTVWNLFMDRNITPIKATCTTPTKYQGMSWQDVLGRMDCSSGFPDTSLVDSLTSTTTEENDHGEVQSLPDTTPKPQAPIRPDLPPCVAWGDVGCIDGSRRG